MGAFQGVAAGLGGQGEDMGAGFNQTLNEALKVRAQTAAEQNEAARIGLAQQQQKQNYTLAQQQHDLLRQQLISSGWRDLGATVQQDGTYARNFQNLTTGETKTLPMQGVPPDSFPALMSHYQTLLGQKNDAGEPIFSEREAKQIAFKVNNLYRETPQEILSSFQEEAASQANKGLKAIQVPGFGRIDISSPDGQSRYAQIMFDNYYGKGALMRAAMGFGPGSGTGANRDMTGFTAGERRDYQSYANSIDTALTAKEKFYGMLLQGPAAFDPDKVNDIQKRFLEDVDKAEKAKDDKYKELEGRRIWSRTQFKQVNPTATEAQIKLAEQQARASGKQIRD